MGTTWTILGIAAVVVLLVVVIWLLRRVSRVPIPVARQLFKQQTGELQTQFFQAASSSGKPRGLIWKSCEFGDELTLARDRKSGELLALVPVTIAFEAVAGSDMEGLPAVGNLRCATAVFHFRGGAWTTSGRAAFNLNPAETLKHFHNQYEPIPLT